MIRTPFVLIVTRGADATKPGTKEGDKRSAFPWLCPRLEESGTIRRISCHAGDHISTAYAYSAASMQWSLNALLGTHLLRWNILQNSRLSCCVMRPATWIDRVFFSYRSRYLWIWFLTSHQSLYLSLHQVTVYNFTESCGHYQRVNWRAYPMQSEHIQDIISWILSYDFIAKEPFKNVRGGMAVSA